MNLLFPACFLFGIFTLTVCSSAFLRLGKFQFKEIFRSSSAPFLFFRSFLKLFFPKYESENLSLCLSLAKHILLIAYTSTAIFFAIHWRSELQNGEASSFWVPIGLFGTILAISFAVDLLARLLVETHLRFGLQLTSPFASLYLMALFPLIGIFLPLIYSLRKKRSVGEGFFTDKSKIREMIRDSDLQQYLDPTDQKLIASFVNFKERVGKEIMVPRVDLYALPADSSIEESAPLFVSEGYSRIPIYRESLDQIVGVVLYKDLLKCYTEPQKNLKAPLETIAKPVLYAPENKKITQLLQEFRNKQIHMAIIVDEYGGTEGIVTIEDILEELVGEIEDEYDVNEEHEFLEIPGGGWVVDAKMTIHDIEEQLALRIPPNPEYETIGGYVYHCAGTIPPKGWRLSHDEFDLEVLSSNERSIKKIKLQTRKKSN